MRRKRINPFFELFEQMRKEMEEMMSGNLFDEKMIHDEINKLRNDPKSNSKVYGVHITVGPDGKPKIEEFGNVKNNKIDSEEIVDEEKMEEIREPLIEIHKDNDEYVIVAEVPGASKDSVKVNLIGKDTLEIKVDSEKRQYYKKLKLPGEAENTKINATYKNGILEIRVKAKKTNKNKKSKSIPIK